MALIHKLSLFALCVTFGGVCASSWAQNAPPSVKDDTARLYSDDIKVRSDAAARLAAAGIRGIPVLVSVVCDKTKARFDVAWPIAAKVLGDMKAAAAAPCLISLLAYKYPPIGPVNGKSDETLASVDPAFSALRSIGEPAVPALRKHLPFLGPDEAIMALRVLRTINTASSREAVEAYVELLQAQVRVANQILGQFE